MEQREAEAATPSKSTQPTPTPQPIKVSGTNPAIESGALALHPVTDLTQLSAGPCVSGQWQDMVLKNDHLECVFGNPTPRPGDVFRPGTLLDVAHLPTDRDCLWAFLPNYGDRKAKMVTTSLETRTTGYPNHGAAVVVHQRSRELTGLTATTEYILEPKSDSLRIVSTWQNNTSQTLRNLALGDLMEWGAGNGFLPGKGALDPSKHKQGESEYLAIIQARDTYVLASKNGSVQVDAYQNSFGTTYRTVTLTVGGQVTVERRLFVGDRDLAALGGQVYEYAKVPYGWIAGRLVEVARTAKGELMDLGPIAGGEIQVIAAKRNGKVVDALGFTRTFTNKMGEYIVPLPEGSFHIRGVKLGHIQPQPIYGVAVHPNQTTAVDLTVGPACRLELNVVDSATSKPIPCKVTFENMINTPPLDFGPSDSLAGRNVFYSITGRETFDVEPGNFRIIVTRGPEYDSVEKLMRLEPGKVQTLNAVLRRVVPTKGWISVDAGVRTNATRGCVVTPQERVITAAAEGVDYIFSGDENVATDLSKAADQMGVTPYVGTGIGMEIPATWQNPLGVFMAFPLKAGAPDFTISPTSSPDTLFKRIRALYPGSLLTVLRPIFPNVGYYTIFGYNEKTHQLPKKAGFSEAYDVLEAWEGKRAGARLLALPVAWAEIFAGHRHGLLAGSHSSGVVDQEVGYPRTYVQVPDDDPQRVSPQEIADSIRAGRVVLTNGPFIDFKVQGKGPGSLVTAVNGYVDVEMTVWAANWVNTYTYELDQNGAFLTTNINPAGNVTAPLRYPGKDDRKVRKIRCKTDCILNGVAIGGKPLSPIVTPFAPGEQGLVYPYAITGPVYVDADGDGKCTPPTPTLYQPSKPKTEEIEE